VKTRISGIPCEVEIVSIYVQKPIPNADSDWDYNGYTDIEFIVCDRNGRPAPWLERKMTSNEREQIELEILKEAERDHYDCAV